MLHFSICFTFTSKSLVCFSQLHIPEGGMSALSNELLNSFEQSNEEPGRSDRLNVAGEVPTPTPQSNSTEQEGVATVVAQHYNHLSERGVAERKESRIFHMRNLNNWIKSRIIGTIHSLATILSFVCQHFIKSTFHRQHFRPHQKGERAQLPYQCPGLGLW